MDKVREALPELPAMTAASNAEKEARVLLATLKPATKGAES